MTYDALELTRTEAAAFVVAARADLDAAVPSCPKWQVRQLVAHLGGVYEWCALNLPRGTSEPPTATRPVHDPADPALLEWFDEVTDRVLQVLREAPPGGPAWSFAAQHPQTTDFWPRRMALETAVHRWDAQSAHRDASGFDLPVAVDGIDEVLTVMRPAQLAHRRTELTGVVGVRLTDADRNWTVRVEPSGMRPTPDTPDAVLTGTASGVLLGLWGRVPLSSLSLTGDEALASAVRAS